MAKILFVFSGKANSMLLISNLLLGEKTLRASAPNFSNSFLKSGENQWACLRHARILARSKPLSSVLVRDTGFEPVTYPTSRGRSTNWANRANFAPQNSDRDISFGEAKRNSRPECYIIKIPDFGEKIQHKRHFQLQLFTKESFEKTAFNIEFVLT